MFGPDQCPRIKLSPEDRALYDQAANTLLQETMEERSKFNTKYIDPRRWTLVKRRKEVSIFSSVPGSTNESIVAMLGTGFIDGRLEDIMGGLYCDTTHELRTNKVLLGYDLKTGSVLNVYEDPTPEDPFRFAGIKWFTEKRAWGLQHHRGGLTYERMGTTTDASGHKLAYHTLQSIKRPEWPSESTPGMLRQHTASCYLYRRHKRTNKTEIFLWGSILKFGSAPEKAIQLGVANTWLNVVRSPRGGLAKKFSALMDEADSHEWMPSSTNCHVCSRRKPKLGSHPLCAGCHQSVCKHCSERHYIFELSKSGRVRKRLFCAVCIKSVTGKAFRPRSNQFILCSTSIDGRTSASSRCGHFFSCAFI
ncbi:Short/branched chain specific acyl-CoA dehydrogenase [Phytophthora cinnamomi]|uniref:Short/branched chain specific acyl-CoA dehydrogenase n=1 Tax=Phytophthora cinnamomi TaxID=4785 RepID=UPI003559DEED|nr:Short/branched chain specific acyl-CoA dehydrogenase [Phytophthora cinnamomi]